MNLHEKNLTELATGSSWVFFGLLTGRMLEYVNRIMIARFYGPSAYGIICLGLTLSMVAASLSLLGLNVGATRYVAIYSSQKEVFRVKGLVHTSLKIVFPASLILALLFLLFRDFIAVEFFKKSLPLGIMAPFILMVPCMAIAEFSYSCLRGLKLAKYAAISKEVLGRIATFLSLAILIFFGRELTGVGFAYLMGFVAYMAFTQFWLRKNFRGENTASSIGTFGNLEARKLLLFSLPLLFAFVVSHIGIELNTILLGYFKDTTEIGFYSAATPFSQFMNIPLAIFLFMFLPLASEHWHDRNIEALKSVFKTVCRWIFIVSCPIFLGLIFFSQEIITLTFGARFSPAHKAMIILSIGYFFNAICGPTGAVLLATGASKKHFLSVFAGVVMGLSLCLYLIPKFGYIGAAFASMSQLLLVNIVYIIFIYQKIKTLPFNLNAIGGLLFTACLITVFRNVIFTENILVRIIGLFGAYSIAMVITRTVRREDISLLSHVLIRRTPGTNICPTT